MHVITITDGTKANETSTEISLHQGRCFLHLCVSAYSIEFICGVSMLLTHASNTHIIRTSLNRQSVVIDALVYFGYIKNIFGSTDIDDANLSIKLQVVFV